MISKLKDGGKELSRRFIGSLSKLIQTNTTVSSVNGIKLHLITPENQLYYCHDESKLPFPEPWWAFCWPGGRFLSKYILDNPSLFKDKSICDIGSGCGVCSISAALVGASRVVANDIDPYAKEALDLNIDINEGCSDKIEFLIDNQIPWTENDIPQAKEFFSRFDIIICGDMLYDETLSKKLLGALQSHDNVLFGDPGRLGCPQDILDCDKIVEEGEKNVNRLLATYPFSEDGFNSVKIFRLQVS